jgi:RNA polymerase sigma-70 factor, ECF subfamily
MVDRTRVGSTSGLVRCFDRIYDANHRALHAYFLGRTGDPEAALDLSQEAFLRVWRNVSKLQDLTPQRQRYWLFTVARNLVADLYRGLASQRATRQNVAASLRTGGNSEEGPQAQLESRERLEAVDRAMSELSEDLRTALVMQVMGRLSSSQIGEALQVPAGTVRYRIAMARKRLAELMRLEEDVGTKGRT